MINLPTLDDQTAINKVWRWGYFRADDAPEAHNVTKRDLGKLKLTDTPVAQAVASNQKYMAAELDRFTLMVHGRPSEPDGVAADATGLFWMSPRCDCPDWPMTPEDDPEIAPLWNSAEANWPDQCRRELTVGRGFPSLPGLTVEQTEGIYWGIANNCTAPFTDVVVVPRSGAGGPDGLKVHHELNGLGSGILAYQYLARDRCDDMLPGAWNLSVTWKIVLAVTTGTHEFLHALGGNHNNDPTATLFPSINTAAQGRMGYLNDTDIRTLVALGYKVHADWASRKPPEDKLFKPRGEPDDPGPRRPTKLCLYWSDGGEPLCIPL